MLLISFAYYKAMNEDQSKKVHAIVTTLVPLNVSDSGVNPMIDVFSLEVYMARNNIKVVTPGKSKWLIEYHYFLDHPDKLEAELSNTKKIYVNFLTEIASIYIPKEKLDIRWQQIYVDIHTKESGNKYLTFMLYLFLIFFIFILFIIFALNKK